jgi:hypothetical protein
MCDRCGLVYQSTPLNASELRGVNRNLDETLRRLQPERVSHKILQGQERWAWIMDRLSREGQGSIDTLLEIGIGWRSGGPLWDPLRGWIGRNPPPGWAAWTSQRPKR